MKNEKFAATLSVGDAAYTYYPVEQVEGSEKLPYALKVLLENVLRNAESPEAASDLAKRVIEAGCAGEVGSEVEFSPARVLFQDFTGVPVFVDFAVMREACANLGGDPAKINPQIPCDLVIDHSVIADVAGCSCAMEKNMELEFQRNGERYNFLKWAQKSFQNVRIVPPGAGICHQLNIEQFAQVAMTSTAAGVETPEGENPTVYFDTLVGTDSHTPTANGIGVLGWGVGVGPADHHAGSQGSGRALDGQAVRGRRGHGRGADVREDAAREGCCRLLRRVLRPWPGQPERHAAHVHLQHDAGIRQHLHAVPR